MRSAIEIFCSRVVFRRFFRKNYKMADEYDANAGGNRGSLLRVILANVLWILRLQALVKQRVLWNVYASVFSRLSVTEWVDVKSDLSLQTSELVRVLFAFCSMTPVPTTMATLCLHLWSIIGSLKLISTLRLSIQTVGQASEAPGLCSRGWETVPRHGRARLRHGRGDTDLIDSLGFVSHSIDLNQFVCFLLCMIIVQ